MCVDMCIGVCIGVCIDMCIDVSIDVHMDMHRECTARGWNALGRVRYIMSSRPRLYPPLRTCRRRGRCTAIHAQVPIMAWCCVCVIAFAVPKSQILSRLQCQQPSGQDVHAYVPAPCTHGIRHAVGDMAPVWCRYGAIWRRYGADMETIGANVEATWARYGADIEAI